MCFGKCMGELLPRLLLSNAYQADVFHAALVQNKIAYIEDAQAAGFTSKLRACSFVILPLMLNF